MPFASFVVGSGEYYHRIGRAKVQTAAFSEVESDTNALLKKTDIDNEDEEKDEELKQLRFIARHRTSAFARKSVHRLIEGNMKLSIRRVDDTTFVVEVFAKATVLELKSAVQRKFEASDAGGCQISWPHVWGNFCLCFKNQKLLDDTVVLHQLGIKEYDELYFLRHVATRPLRYFRRRAFFNGLRKK